MSGYDEMTTDELRRLALGPRPLKAVAVALADRLAEAEQKLAAYEPIVAGLKTFDIGNHYAIGCPLCGGGELVWSVGHVESVPHADDCPWWLAQQTGGDQ